MTETIDRIDNKGNITEHYREAGARRTWCGLKLGYTQPACGGKPCGRCARIMKQRGSK